MDERRISEEEVLRVSNGPDLAYPSHGKRVAEDVLRGRENPAGGLRVDTPGTEADARIMSAMDQEEVQP